MSRNRLDLHPRLQTKIEELEKLCQKNGLKIGIGECLRTTQEQEALYAQGRTKPGSIVTNARGTSYSSQHQWGIAFDFYRNDGTGAYNESGNFFDKVGALAKSIGLGWGGDWKSIVDKPHLHLPDWGSTTASLKQQYGTPEKFIQSWTQAKEKETYTKTMFIKDVQKAIGVTVDGIAGKKTLEATVTVSATQNRNHSVVKPIQKRLYALGYKEVGNADGIAGEKFAKAVKAYKKKNGYKKISGKIAAKKKMWKSLLGMN